jgi:hypothetical protein
MTEVNRPAKEAAARYSTAKDCAQLLDLWPPAAIYGGGYHERLPWNLCTLMRYPTRALEVDPYLSDAL